MLTEELILIVEIRALAWMLMQENLLNPNESHRAYIHFDSVLIMSRDLSLLNFGFKKLNI